MHVDLFHGVHDEGVDLWEETDGEYDGQTEHQNYKTGDGTSTILYMYHPVHQLSCKAITQYINYLIQVLPSTSTILYTY